MSDGADDISRISKLLVDRQELAPDAVLARRRQFAVSLVCGDDVASSYTLQLAVLTAARIAIRCFPEAVSLSASPALLTSPLRLWPRLRLTLGQALAAVLGQGAVCRSSAVPTEARSLVFGSGEAPAKALRVTFDGWCAQVGPASSMGRLPERELFPPTGILAAALALSELFLSFAEISVQATRRVIGLSLWRPDLDATHPDALGIVAEFLPAAQWLLGLGHLGNCYLWALGSLPYADPAAVEFALFDFDAVDSPNIETCLLFAQPDVGALKTRMCAAWLERRGFRTRLIERRFDGTFRRYRSIEQRLDEPGLAFCGFDSNASRRDLATAEFTCVIECGLGAMAHNFDTLALHTLPHHRPAAELWPDLTQEQTAQMAQEQERLARENPGYAALGKDRCGRELLAGKAVGVPFVGAVAASHAVAEAVRLLHGGPAFSDFKLNLGTPTARSAITQGNYDADALSGMRFAEVHPNWTGTS